MIRSKTYLKCVRQVIVNITVFCKKIRSELTHFVIKTIFSYLKRLYYLSLSVQLKHRKLLRG